MLAADQVIGSMVEISSTRQHNHDVIFTVSHVDLPGLRHLLRVCSATRSYPSIQRWLSLMS